MAPGSAWCRCRGAGAGDSYDDILASTDPSTGGGSWTASPVLPTGLGIALTALDCASASRCTAAVSDGTVLTSSDPAGGAAAWTRSGVIGPSAFGTSNQTAMACRPDASCLIPYIGGGLANVAFGPPATATLTGSLSGLTEIRGLSCPSKTLCIGVDDAGAVLRSSTPAGDASSWKRRLQPAVTNGLKIGAIYSSSKPTAGAKAFKRVKLTTSKIVSISCRSSKLCVAIGLGGRAWSSSNPSGGRSTWHSVLLDNHNYPTNAGGFGRRLIGLACAPKSVCVTGDAAGRVFSSTG